MNKTPSTHSSKSAPADLQLPSLDQFIKMLKLRKVLWELHLGTIQLASSLGVDPSGRVTSITIPVLLDGDTDPIAAKSLINNPLQGARVSVIFVPPSGYYIIGSAGVADTTGQLVCCGSITANSNASSSAGVEVLAIQTNTGTFKNNHIFEANYGWAIQVPSNATITTGDLILREDKSGLELWDFGDSGWSPIAGAVNLAYPGQAFFINTSGLDIITAINLFVKQVRGSGNVLIPGSAARPAELLVWDRGPVGPNMGSFISLN